MRKRIAAALLGLLLVAATTFSAEAKDVLVAGYSAVSGIHAGIWVAEEGKIFEKYNIDPRVVLIPSASKMVQAMLGGDVVLAAAGGNAAVEADLAGADLVMVGSLASVPAFYIMALHEIKSIEDLRGKAVGVTRFGSSTDFTMRYVLRKHGLEPGRDVTIIQTGDLFAAAAALRTHTIVAAPFSSPTNLRAQEAGARVLVNMGTAGIHFPHDAWMARRSFVNSHGDLLRRFLAAYSEGVYRLHTDPDLSRRAISRFGRTTDPKIIDAVYQYAMDYVDKIPYNTPDGIQVVLSQIAAKNAKARTSSPQAFYDDRFIRELETSGFYKKLWGK